jgi:hypothetical protein
MKGDFVSRAPVWAVLLSLTVWPLVGCGGGGGAGSTQKKQQSVEGFRVVESTPRDGAKAVAIDSAIRLKFSQALNINSVSTDNVVLSLRSTSTPLDGAIDLEDGNTIVVFTPDDPLLLNTNYRIRVLADVLSSTGDALGTTYESTFKTAVTSDNPPPPDPQNPLGQIVLVSYMNRGRSSHCATLMQDGKVLITGGFADSISVTNSAEVYDGTNLVFTYTPESMEEGRAFHTATQLEDGRVMIVGGVTGSKLPETTSVEFYNPQNGTFETLSPGLNYARAFHTATLLEDGRVLIAGGTVPTPSGVYSSDTAEIFDPVTDRFSVLSVMWTYRAAHTATLLDDGRVLILGGNSTSPTIEWFDPDLNYFVKSDEYLKVARRGHSATRLTSTGDVIIFGGGSKSAGIWLAKQDLYRWTIGIPVEERKDHTANVTESGRILFTGGSRYDGSRLLFSQTTEYYNRFTETFISAAPTLAFPVTRHRATVLKSGNILLTGGSNVDPNQPEHRGAMIYTEKD